MNGGLSSTLKQAKQVKCPREGTGEVSRGRALPSAIFANIRKIYTWREQNLVAPSVALSLLSPKCPPVLSDVSPIILLMDAGTRLLPGERGYGPAATLRALWGAQLSLRTAARLSLRNED